LNADTLSTEEREELVARLKVQSKKLLDTFAVIEFKTLASLEKKKYVTCKKLKRLIKSSSYRSLCRLFKDSMTVDDLFEELSQHWSFLDYGLLKLIINTYCPELSGQLVRYMHDLEVYCRRRIVEVPTDMLEFKPTGKTTIYVKYEKDFFTTTLSSIKELEADLSVLLNTPLRLLEIKEGCIQLVFEALNPLIRKEHCQLPEMNISSLNIRPNPGIYISRTNIVFCLITQVFEERAHSLHHYLLTFTSKMTI
jgi:hypothetical protein